MQLALAQRLTFSLANTGAVLAALYVAFARDLDRPYWAMFTVFIIAKPVSGAVRSKAVYRFVGTCVGAAMAVVLIPPLVQAPVLLCLAISLWVGLCLYLSLLDRTPRSYALMLAGYSVTIIGFSVVNTPEAIFDVAVARLEEISLGIACGSIAHSVFFPRNVATELNERIAATLDACEKWIARALQTSEIPDISSAQRQLAHVVTELHMLYTHVDFDTSDVARSGRIMHALQHRLTLLLPYVTDLRAAVEAMQSADSQWRGLLKQTAVLKRRQLLDALGESRQLAEALKNTRAVPSWITETGNPRLTADRGLALLSAGAAMVAVLVACVLWIEGSWPEGAVAAQFAAIGCSLFATLDRPSRVISSAIVGVLLSLPLGAVYVFAIIPQVDGFPSLALVLLPVLMLFSFMQTVERLEGAALVLAIGFSGALALQSSYRADFAAFINTNTAEIAGLVIAVVTNLAFRTIDPIWNAQRITRANRRSVQRLACAPRPQPVQAWTIRMFDRIGQITARDTRADALRDLRVGLNIAVVREYRDLAKAELDRVLGGLADYPKAPVRDAIDAGLRKLSPAAPPRLLAALTSLRLDLES